MRMFAAGLTLVAAAVLVASPASASWVWRDGKWIYIEDREPAPPAPGRAAPSPARPVPPPAMPSERAPLARETPAPPTPAPAPEPVKPAPVPVPAPPPLEAPPGAEGLGAGEGHGGLPPAARSVKPPTPAPPAARSVEPPTPAPPAAEAPAPPTPAKRSWFGKRPPAEPDADRHLFERGKGEFDAGRHAAAAAAFRELIKGWPTSEFRADAMWLRGEALFARKDYYKAFEQYEELLGEYAGSPHYGDALQREMEIAELYLGPVRRKVLGMPLLSGEDEAIAILRRVYEHQPLGDLADDVILRIADYYWNKRDWPEAEQYYDKYCREYPNVDPGKVRHAERRRAECGLEKCRGVRYDTTSLNLAYDRLNQYEQKYPDAAQSEGVAELKAKVRGMQAETMFRVAEYYLRSGRPTAAAYYAEQVQRDYPDTAWSAKSERFLQKLAMKAPPTPSEAAPPAPEPPAESGPPSGPAEPGAPQPKE